MKKNASASKNIRNARIILILLILFSSTLGFVIGKLFDNGYLGASIATGLSLFYAFVCYMFSDQIILLSLKAKKIPPENNAQLYNKTADLAKELQLPVPSLYYIDDSAMNCLALGRKYSQAKIIMTKGLIDKLSSPEIEAVIAHELSHIKVMDTRVHAYTTVIVALFPFVAESLRRKSPLFLPISVVLSLFSPFAALFMQLVISPKREYEADASAALLTRYPQGLAEALEKITNDPYSVATAMQATAHLFIVNPFHAKANRSPSSLFTTHPAIEERIKVLRSM